MRFIRQLFLVAAVIALLPSSAAQAGGGVPPDSSGSLPYVHRIGTKPAQPCHMQPVSLVLQGNFPDGCGEVIDSFVSDPGHVFFTLKVGAGPDTACTLPPVPWRVDFDLGALPEGFHDTEITLTVIFFDTAGSAFRREFYSTVHTFFVHADCDSLPWPPPGPLPYVTEIAIGRDVICQPDLVCPGDSIPVRIEGFFPNDCFAFRRIELLPSLLPVYPPPPPIVRVVVDDSACVLRQCKINPVPWSASVLLPPRPPGGYQLQVQLAQVSCSDSFPPGTLHSTEVPFVVQERCDPPEPCMVAGFRFGADPGSICDATVSPDRPAELVFLVAPTVALAGLQGEIRLLPSALDVLSIETMGPAQGMFLSWNRTREGARFVLFATVGAPIPSWPPPDYDPRGGGYPVLRVLVGQAGAGEIPDRTQVFTEGLLGSDINGQGVRVCPPPPCVDIGPADPRLLRPVIICSELGCDFNADGLEDVRDLVLMVHCVLGDGPCPPDAGTRFDCDGDSTLGVPDVICCARHMLQRPPCPGCGPDSGTVRPEPRVSVSFGSAEVHGDEIGLPVRIAGTDYLGAAMLTLEAPLDRYEVTGFDVDPPGNWLALHEARDGRLVLGLVDVRGNVRSAVLDNARFTLHLRLRPGQPPGGIVTATAGQFSGPDGVALDVQLGRPTQALPGRAVGGLSPNQPNPFSRETAFTLEIAQASDVAVVIYDLRGRTVATLHRAALSAGPHVFRWDGRSSDGSEAPNGVYFYQATVGGRSVARKLILMRGD